MASHGFEFRRDLEQLVHDGVLSSRSAAQRSRFLPGVLAASREPADVQLQQRSKKKLQRALRSLQEDYGASLELSREALGYCNSLEDALSFLALQHASDELPPTLRALPTQLQSVKEAEEDGGELLAELNEKKKEEEENNNKEDNCEEKKAEKEKEALTWTQQYVLTMAAREEEMASRAPEYCISH